MVMPTNFTFSLITNCSSSRTIEPIARVGDLEPGHTMRTAMDRWLEMCKVPAERLTTPSELYRGMGFMTIAKIQEQYKPKEVHIITGGMGFCTLDEKITPYDFTASKNEPENIYQAVTAEPFVQTVWWRMINSERGKGTTPIADHIRNTDYNLYLVSMGKVFIRYIAEDILSIPSEKRSRIRILLAASSVGSVPAQLRPMIIPFDREVIAHMPGNRNDSNHRAAQHYLHLIESDPEFANLPIDQQRIRFANQGGSDTAAKIDLNAVFEARPYLLQMSMDDAFKAVRREFGAFGGKMYFRSIWRKASGVDIEVSAGEVNDAAAALEGMSFLGNTSKVQTSNSEEDITLRGLKSFVEALRTIAPTAIFSAANVTEWAKKKYGAAIPQSMSQPNKLAYILKNNFGLLGLIETGIAGASTYTIKADPIEDDD